MELGQIRKALLLFLAAGILAVSLPASAGGRKLGEMPAPELVSPSDETDLAGKSELEFLWRPQGGSNYDHFDFRLYKGPQTYEKGLILKKEIPKNTHSVKLDAAQFESGQTYAWSLRYAGSSKSRSSYSVFNVKK